MSELETVVVDWSAASLTESARNSKVEDRRRVVSVPRKALPKWSSRPWSEIEAGAAAGIDGLVLHLIAGIDYAPKNVAYLRAARMGGVGREGEWLRDRGLLYSQGWDATN